MLTVNYPNEAQLRLFATELKSGEYRVSKYLPPIDENWYATIGSCIAYVEQTAHYEDTTFMEVCARLLYKVAKRHELGDGNKRSSVIALYLFCLVNDYIILSPALIKKQAKRIAATKGRANEAMMRKRIALVLEEIIFSEEKLLQLAKMK